MRVDWITLGTCLVFLTTYYSISKHVSNCVGDWCHSFSVRPFMFELNLIKVLEAYRKFLNGEMLDTSSLKAGENEWCSLLLLLLLILLD